VRTVSPTVAAICIRRLPIDQIKPHPRNPREHPKPDSPVWQVLKKSVEHDYFDPLVWNERNGCLVSRHFRRKVMESLGIVEVDVSVVDYDEPTHYARMIAANRPLGDWENTILASLAGEIDLAGVDAALAGYDTTALMALVDPLEVEGDDDNAEQLLTKADELQIKWQVHPGDLYQIGSHRLLCGDCSSMDNWQRILEGGKADMLWCDPPYNVAYDQSLRRRIKDHVTLAAVTILNDDLPGDEYCAILKAWLNAGATMLKQGGAFYIAHAESYSLETRMAAREAGLDVRQCLIWVKQAWTLGRQDYQWQHEPILYGWRPGAGHYWQGGYSQSTIIDDDIDLKKLTKGELITLIGHMRNATDTTVIREPRNVVSDLHPTIKPVRLVARHIWNSSRRGDTVLELFGGSGTTLIAAEQLGRRCVATELDPKYCAVILERLTGAGLTATKLHGPHG
jgi:hypothetical protein